MAHTTWVLVNKSRLPEPADLTHLATRAGWPLEIDGDWSWAKHTGFLPMKWDGTKTGCEISLERLPKKERDRAAKAGFEDLDAFVEVTQRLGWVEPVPAELLGLIDETSRMLTTLRRRMRQ